MANPNPTNEEARDKGRMKHQHTKSLEELEQMEVDELAKYIENINPKYLAFLDKYIETDNIGQSYMAAGFKSSHVYSASVNGCRVLKLDYSKVYLRKLMDSKSQERIAKQDEILEYLTNVMRGNTLEDTLVVLSKGNFQKPEIIQKQPAEKDRLKAAELLGKRYALFTDNHQVKATVNAPEDWFVTE